MAIGDTVQAGLGRMDFSAFQRAGEAQARANEAFGNAIGGVVEKYYQKKKDKQDREEREQAYRKMGFSTEEAKAASGDKDLANQFMNKMVADRNYQLRKEEFDRQQSMLDEQKAGRDRFITMLTSQAPTGKLNEAGQDELERGSLFLAPGPEAQEKFRDELLQDPNLQQTEPVMGMSGNRFMAQFANESPAVQERALAFMQAEQKRLSEQATAGMEDFETLRKAEGDLRKEFNALPVVKDFNKVRTAYEKVKQAGANPSPAGDLSLIFNYMKILDPGSVVREGEFANAQNAGGIDTKIRNLYNQIIDGTRLSPDQRQDFLNQSKNAASAEFKGASEALDQYKGLAANSGLRVDQIIPSNYLQIEEELSPSQPQGPGIDTKQGTYSIPGLSVEAQ
jgi:hypothetical protein